MAKQTKYSNQQQDITCMTTWEDELKTTQNQLVEVCAERDKFQKQYNNATTWTNKLKKYWDWIQETEELIKIIASELQVFKKHTNKVCMNTKCTNEAVEILYCCVIAFYQCTDQLKQQIYDLFNKIDCLNDPEINTSSSVIYKCLTTLTTKLEEALQKQKETLANMIEVLKCAYMLDESICSAACGLINDLDNLGEMFPPAGDDKPGPNCDFEQSCEAEIAPKPMLPLRKDDFYQITWGQYDTSKDEKDKIRQDYDEAWEDCEALNSCKTSLKDAIDASNAAKECK